MMNRILSAQKTEAKIASVQIVEKAIIPQVDNSKKKLNRSEIIKFKKKHKAI